MGVHRPVAPAAIGEEFFEVLFHFAPAIADGHEPQRGARPTGQDGFRQARHHALASISRQMRSRTLRSDLTTRTPSGVGSNSRRLLPPRICMGSLIADRT